MIVSDARREANRRNARLSTGPRTEHGKRAVARNAIKHGLLAREVVITAGDGEEDLQEFDSFLDRLWQEYEPVGVREETFVQRIATCWWRQARVLRAENKLPSTNSSAGMMLASPCHHAGNYKAKGGVSRAA